MLLMRRVKAALAEVRCWWLKGNRNLQHRKGKVREPPHAEEGLPIPLVLSSRCSFFSPHLCDRTGCHCCILQEAARGEKQRLRARR